MIYAMSDIHGCIGELQKNMEQVDLGGDNRIVFCGDYIDYGDSSYYILKYLWDLHGFWVWSKYHKYIYIGATDGFLKSDSKNMFHGNN